MSEKVISVAVVEDDITTLSALVLQFTARDDMRLAGYARELQQARAMLTSGPVDVLLLDLDLAGDSALPLIPLATDCGARVLVLSNLGDEQSVLAAIQAGASGYVLKDDAVIDLVTAVRHVLLGEAPISSAVASIVLRQLRNTQPAQGAVMPELSGREQQILQGLAEGLTYRDIAAQLHLSYHTVSDHTKSIYRKLQVNSRGQAVAKFFHGAQRDSQFA